MRKEKPQQNKYNLSSLSSSNHRVPLVLIVVATTSDFNMYAPEQIILRGSKLEEEATPSWFC